MHKIFSVTDILVEIFAHLTRKTVVPCVGVCKAWAEIARDRIWANVEDPKEIFNLLVPLHPEQKCFSRVPTVREWHAFRNNYARRVHTFNVDPSLTKLMGMIYDAHLRAAVFPNLRVLRWRDELDCKLMLPFAHPGLLTLGIVSRSRTLPSLSSPLPTVLDTLSFYAPNLTSLDVFYQEPRICPNITLYLLHFTAVQKIKFNPFRAAREDIEAISTLPQLQSFSFIYSPSRWYFDDAPFIEPVNGARLDAANIADSSFCNLRHLELVAALSEVTWLMSGKGNLSALKDLHLYTPGPPDLQDLRKFLSTSAQNLHGLEKLIMCFAPASVAGNFRDSSFLDPYRPAIQITCSELHLLCRFKTLKVVKIHHAHPLTLNNAELCDALQGLPTIEHLYLNPDPVFDTDGSNLTIDVFHLIAVQAPNLTHLGLFLNTSGFWEPVPTPRPRFRALKRLNLGRTDVSTSLMRRNLAFEVCRVLPLHSGSIDLLRWGTSGLQGRDATSKDNDDRWEFGMELDVMLKINQLAAEEAAPRVGLASDNGRLTTLRLPNNKTRWKNDAEYL